MQIKPVYEVTLTGALLTGEAPIRLCADCQQADAFKRYTIKQVYNTATGEQSTRCAEAFARCKYCDAMNGVGELRYREIGYVIPHTHKIIPETTTRRPFLHRLPVVGRILQAGGAR